MAITTLDGVVSGAQWTRYFAKAATPTLVDGKPQSLWGLGGNPAAGAFNTTLAGVALSSTSAQVTGQIHYSDPPSGNSYLARFISGANSNRTIILADRLWHNGGFTITSTGSQTVNSATFPSRDVSGSTNGLGVFLALEISSAAGAAAPTITVTYTNSSGTGSRTGTNSFATANSPAAGSFFPIGLQAGDYGVRSVQSLQLSSSWVSGTMNLVAYRVIAVLESYTGNVSNSLDALSAGMPRLYDGTVPFIFVIPNGTTATTCIGSVVYTFG